MHLSLWSRSTAEVGKSCCCDLSCGVVCVGNSSFASTWLVLRVSSHLDCSPLLVALLLRAVFCYTIVSRARACFGDLRLGILLATGGRPDSNLTVVLPLPHGRGHGRDSGDAGPQVRSPPGQRRRGARSDTHRGRRLAQTGEPFQ